MSERGSDEVFHVTSSFCQDGSCVAAARVVTLDGEERVHLFSTVDGGDTFTRDEWDAFVAGVKNGEFDWGCLNVGQTA